MTPYELSLFAEAKVEREEAELKERLTLVWLGEYYHRTKKLPALQSELKKVSSAQGQKVMSDEEMLQVAKRLNTQFGGNVVKRSAETDSEKKDHIIGNTRE